MGRAHGSPPRIAADAIERACDAHHCECCDAEYGDDTDPDAKWSAVLDAEDKREVGE